MAEMAAFLVPLGLFAAITIPLYYHLKSRHTERLALIEKGIVTEDVKYLYDSSHKRSNPFGSLKWGLVLIFVGLGLFLAQLATIKWGLDDSTYPAMISLGAGLALIIFYRIAIKQREKLNGD